MIYISVIIFLAIFLIGCYYHHNYQRYSTVRPFTPSPELLEWVNSLKTPKDAQDWIVHHIKYRFDHDLWKKKDYWATPQETWEKRAGDCESQHILMAWAVSVIRQQPAYLFIVNKNRMLSHGIAAYYDDPQWVVLNYWQTLRGNTVEELLPKILDGCLSPLRYTYITEKWEIPSGRRLQ